VEDPKQPHTYQPGQPPPAPGQAPVSPSEEKTWTTLVHISPLLLGFVGPVIVWAIYKDRSRWIRLHATEALNFSILASIVYVVSYILMFVVIGFITFPVMWVVSLIFAIMAAMAANRGEYKPYPFNARMIK